MNKFFLMTRGRTGSTAVLDELNKCSGICAMQELFLVYDIDSNAINTKKMEDLYNFSLPFILWKRQGRLWKWLPRFLYNDGKWADRYLSRTELLARSQASAALGFKVLSHNLVEWPFLTALLKRRGYQAIYLTRNIASQVLSGMVANRSGVWHAKGDAKDTRRYNIDLDEFQWHVEWEKHSVKQDCDQLSAEGFDFIIVSYDEFVVDRKSFYAKIFNFLNLPSSLPPRSDWSVLIKDLRFTIENYDAVAERAAAIGVPLDS